MNKAALKDLLYGGLTELMNNNEFYYRSSVPQYSNWTETGTDVMLAYIISITKQMQIVEEAELNQRAKDIVIKGLKGETV